LDCEHTRRMKERHHTMPTTADRQDLRRLVELIPASTVGTAAGFLEGLIEEPAILESLAAAPVDDESDDDDSDGGLTTAREEAAKGDTVPHHEVKRRLRIS